MSRPDDLERTFDVPMWCVCIAAFGLVMILPSASKLWWRLLPFAGFYAYHERGLPWRWSERVR